jgi:hypothetical protein
MTIVYDDAFNANEWFVILGFVSLSVLIWLTPKLFPLLEGIAYFVYGVFTGMFFDHTISVKPWDFYDVNDTSAYQVIDFLSYLMYGPFSYFFIYFYVKLGIKGFWHILYLFIWISFSMGMEWIAVQIGVFHYNKGYKMYWSVPIYLIIQSMQIIFYHIVHVTEAKGKGNNPKSVCSKR